jgi:hypothetical protein
VDLTKVAPLFTIYVAERRLKPLLVASLSAEAVKPNTRPAPRKMMKYRLGEGPGGGHAADLVELNETYESTKATVIKSGLRTPQDLNLIYAHEHVGMWGNPEDIRKRLLRYFETGVDWDDSKSFIFKGIQPPPAKSRR